MRGHRKSYKDTEAAMVRPHKKDERKKVVEKKVTEWKPDSRRTRRRPKSRWKEQVLELEGEDPGSEVVEEDHERGIRIGTKKNVK